MEIPLSVFWTWFSLKVVYKINKSVSLHPLQVVYKNKNISRRFSNTRKSFGGNILKQRHCNLAATELVFVINSKKLVLHPTQRIDFFRDDSRLSEDDSVSVSGVGRVDFQKLSGYIADAGCVNKRTSKAFGNIIINSISNSLCTTVQKIPAEITNS